MSGGVSAVFHVGALVPYNLPRAYGVAALEAVNVAGTVNLLTASVQAGVPRFLLASSTGVTFGGADIAGGDETLPVPPAGWQWNDPYSESKARAEAAVLAAHGTPLPGGGRLSTVALRPNGIWGPGEAHHFPKMLLVAQLGAAWLPFGAHALTDWTHREDLAQAFLCAHRQLLGEETVAGNSAGLPRRPLLGHGDADASVAPGAGTLPRVGGRAFFVTSPWKVHTSEFFGWMLQELGFWSPFPSALVRRTAVERMADGRVPRPLWRHVLAAESGIRPQFPLSDDEAIILTTDPAFCVPSWALVPVAGGLQLLSYLLRPLAAIEAWVSWVPLVGRVARAASFEPFLTLADLRKVDRHNYYNSALAETALGWSPSVNPARGMREVVAYYRALGYDGSVDVPPAEAWAAVIIGLAVLGALAYNSGGALSVALAWLVAQPSLAPIAGPQAIAWLCALIARLYNGCGIPALSAAAARAAAIEARHLSVARAWLTGGAASATAKLPPLAFSPAAFALPEALDVYALPSYFGAPEALLCGALQVVFWAAILCHAGQGVWAFRKALEWRQAALAWGLQSAVLGFSSTSKLASRAGWDARRVTAGCIASFVACVPLVTLLGAVGAGVSAGLTRD